MNGLGSVSGLPEGPSGPEAPDDVMLRPSPRKGRPSKLRSKEMLGEVLQLYFVDKLSMREVASLLKVSHMSIYRMLSDPNLELLL